MSSRCINSALRFFGSLIISETIHYQYVPLHQNVYLMNRTHQYTLQNNQIHKFKWNPTGMFLISPLELFLQSNMALNVARSSSFVFFYSEVLSAEKEMHHVILSPRSFSSILRTNTVLRVARLLKGACARLAAVSVKTNKAKSFKVEDWCIALHWPWSTLKHWLLLCQ